MAGELRAQPAVDSMSNKSMVLKHHSNESHDFIYEGKDHGVSRIGQY
jgi:hypothetical protein